MEKDSKIFIAGHRGLVGSALVRKAEELGFSNLILRTRKELDLMDSVAVRQFFNDETPDYVFLAAAKVGGIHANATYPADFIFQNLTIQNNIIDSAYRSGVTKLMFLGSSCIYPKHAEQPIKEDALLSGYLEPTNDAYATAKIAGIKMCQAYHKQYGFNAISVMPTNLYGPGDNFDLQSSHVLPALIRRIHEAKESGLPTVEIWGSGTPLREFLYSDDLADACFFLMDRYDSDQIINIGSGVEVSIKDLAMSIKEVVGFQGELLFDSSKTDGTPRKLMDSTKLEKLGWKTKIELNRGIILVYESFQSNRS